MNKAKLILLLLIFANRVYSQDYTLIGIIDSQLVTIDETTGQLDIYQSLKNVPPSENFVDLTYHTTNNVFYTISNASDIPSLVSISSEGDYQLVGTLTLDGSPIPMAEALAYNAERGKLYAGVSLDGGRADNDFYSESIVEVDPSNGTCTLVSEIATNRSNPDIDVMTFSGDILYVGDGAPPNANFLSIYLLDFKDISTTSPLVQEYNGAYLPIRDFTDLGEYIYFIEQRNLFKYSTLNQTIQRVGTTHTTSEYNGELIQGLSKMVLCELAQVDLGDDQLLCDDNFLILDATYSNATYTWQDGSTSPKYSVTKPGTFWVDVENSCGKISDTIRVEYLKSPAVDLGNNQLLCRDSSFILDVSAVPGTYLWQDGSTNPTFEVTRSGNYWVTIESHCGKTSDTIEINFNQIPEIDLGENRVVCNNTPVELSGTISNGTYQWQDGSTEPVFKVEQSGVYWLEAENDCGSVRDTVIVEFRDLSGLEIPNVFTPNDDEINDHFWMSDAFAGSFIRIFNRWGTLVYQSNDYQNDWDGSNCPAGTYFWQIIDICGNNHKGQVTILK